jgi:hypothetical protein
MTSIEPQEQRTSAPSPARSGGLLILVGIIIRLILVLWAHHDPSAFIQRVWWLPQIGNDVALASIILGCVMWGVYVGRRG